jgi:metal-responsive CopG/Arc/MetJ family transcriptional regulator
MRTLVDIPDKQLGALAEICKQEKLTRAAVVREAIAAYIVDHQSKKPMDAFGLWGKKKIDGLKYQRKIRSEW